MWNRQYNLQNKEKNGIILTETGKVFGRFQYLLLIFKKISAY
jgi:hypothetical protein